VKSTKTSATHRTLAALLFCSVALISARVGAVQVFVPDNGFGTANVPILADYTGETPMQITNGLFGGTIDIAATLETPSAFAETPGGALGGTKAAGGGSGLFTWQMQGTGIYSAYSRTLSFGIQTAPGQESFVDFQFAIVGADFEENTAPRTLNAPIQSFDTVMTRLFGQIVNPADNDPDFDLLRVVAGNDYGMPSPGHTDLLQTGFLWEAYSYFDLAYRIDFIGRPGGQFGGMSGSSQGTVRLSLGEPIVPEPTSAVLAIGSVIALATWKRRRAAF
jgi:hypothetical protein